MYRYTILKSLCIHTGTRYHTGYGLLVWQQFEDEWTPIVAVADISSSKQDVIHLASQYTRFQLNPIHLPEVIADYLAL